MKAKGLKMRELVAYENAANSVRKNYENALELSRGVDYNKMNEEEAKTFTELSQKLTRVNAVRLSILREMERRLVEDIEFDE